MYGGGIQHLNPSSFQDLMYMSNELEQRTLEFQGYPSRRSEVHQMFEQPNLVDLVGEPRRQPWKLPGRALL